MESETVEDILALIAERPADAELWQLLGRCYLRQKQMPEAKEAYDRSLELAPDDPWTHLYLGNWFWGNREHRKALEFFKRAAELIPDEAIVYTCQGDIFRAQGRHDLAEDAYRMAVRVDPDNSDARRKLSEWSAFR